MPLLYARSFEQRASLGRQRHRLAFHVVVRHEYGLGVGELLRRRGVDDLVKKGEARASDVANLHAHLEQLAVKRWRPIVAFRSGDDDARAGSGGCAREMTPEREPALLQ